MGIPVEYSFHEDAPGQQEIDLRHTDALTMADSVMTFRLVVREVAASQGVHATFMPKPLEGVQGSGMHLHMSLFRGDENAFYDADDPLLPVAAAKSFMAGLLRHAAEITAVTNQTVNSYKRLVPGFEAPVHISWARNNRSGLIRVPIAKKGNPLATRIEYRSPDPACNPYLAFSLMLAAGMRGIEQGYELPDEADANLFEIGRCTRSPSSASRSSRSRSPTPCDTMETVELVHEALGEHIFEWFLRNKRREWRDYKTHVSRSSAIAIWGRCESVGRVDGASMLAVVPDPVTPELARTLDLAGYSWKAVASADDAADSEPADGWAGRDRRLHRRPRGRVGVRSARSASSDPSQIPVFVLVGGGQLGDLELRDDLFDDFCLSPFHPAEFEARLRHLLWASATPPPRGRPGRVRPARAQPRDLPGHDRRPAARHDLHGVRAAEVPRPEPGQGVHPRDPAVRVWGYEYYGGARTVDVHVRRLRAKLGEEHAGLIAHRALGRLPLRPVPLGQLNWELCLSDHDSRLRSRRRFRWRAPWRRRSAVDPGR